MPWNETFTEQYCSINSSQASEPLIGSAPRTDYWILLEYSAPMTAYALKQNQLPDEVNSYLATAQEALPASRMLLIHNKSLQPDSSPRLILVDGRDGRAMLYKIALSNYMDLLNLDIPAIFADEANAPSAAGDNHLFLVCTNGKRDACCSKWGIPLFGALEKQYGDIVYQSSHVGGHRFAPNLICLPHGIYYGRVPLSQAGWIADRYLSGHLSLEHYRGLATYPAPAQAAEYLLRVVTGEERIGIYHLEGMSSLGEDRWKVTFSNEHNQVAFQVSLESRQTGRYIYESCSEPYERKPVKEFCLLEPIQAG